MIKTITGDATFEALAARLKGSHGPFSAEGLWGSSAPITAALLHRELSRTLVFVSAHLEQADEARDDMELVGGAVELFPAFETLPGEGAASGEISGERLRLCNNLLSDGHGPLLISAPIAALMQPVPTPEALEAGSVRVEAGQPASLEKTQAWLVDQGFSRLEWVEEPGDYAVRGGILDVFAQDRDLPVRIEFFGDVVESIRLFDLSTQRSAEQLPHFRIFGLLNEHHLRRDQITNLLRYLPQGSIVCWHEPAEIQELGRTFMERLDHPRGMFPVTSVFQLAGKLGQVYCTALGGMSAGDDDRFRFDVRSVQRFEAQTSRAVQELATLAGDRHITVFCDNEAEQQRFREVLADNDCTMPDTIRLEVGFLHSGFEWGPANRLFVGHHELFHRYRQHRKIRRTYASRPLESWLDIKTGDLVVHTVHGIARFKGLAPMRKGESAKQEEFLSLQFADDAILHVPASQIEMVQKYVGAAGVPPPLSKIGGTRWKKTKERVEEAVADFAGELIRVQALRQSLPGIAYPQDTAWQREFEGSFVYTETEDQLKVMAELKADASRPLPMDRLVCGDVGYGKTELAMRAAFKVVEYGKQVAVLVPTTVLAEQHDQTFRERMADYPFVIGCLSRFRSAREQKQLVQAVRKGQVDVLIGTHRMLSKDVCFADLGLLVIDEEQRFGVEHKERLKRFRESVDVLTLTATPIPRTLHLSMLGIRDISSLATPPVDRRSIVTQVRRYDRELIRSAIVREMNRDGQVYFVHNLVYDIGWVADEIVRIVPEARVVVGHGQMKAEELEQVMTKFARHEADVLVCTNIIESGIDIPSANTIFIDRAERFGLADLHQLRGRVGRYRHRAYCYLLLAAEGTISPVAAKRLKAIEEYSDLGAGFRIAMRDLELRGAGNILGPEQSGHIAAVGYEMYCQLLDSAVRRMKGAPQKHRQPVHLELDVAAHIPKSYIAADNARIEVYRQLAACIEPQDVRRVGEDLRDAFGPYPRQLETLLDLAELRTLAQPWGIRSIMARQPDVIFEIEDLSRAEPAFRDGDEPMSGSVRMPDPHTIHWRLSPSAFEPRTLLALLRRRLTFRQPA